MGSLGPSDGFTRGIGRRTDRGHVGDTEDEANSVEDVALAYTQAGR